MRPREYERINDPEILPLFAENILTFFDRPEDVEKLGTRIDRINRFIAENRLPAKSRGEEPGLRRLAYRQEGPNSLYRLMELCEITGEQFFEIVEATVPPISPDRQEIIDRCDTLPPERRLGVLELAEALSTRWWMQEDNPDFSGPSSKLYAAYFRTTQRGRSLAVPEFYQIRLQRLREELNLSEETYAYLSRFVFNDQSTSNIPCRILPLFLEIVGAGPHWALGLPNHLSYYSCTPETDRIISAYCFMPKLSREAFLQALRCVEKGSVEA